MAQEIVSGEDSPEPRVSSSPLTLVPAWVYSCLIVGAFGIYTWSRALSLGNGVIGYALDDAYIHMAIAKNFAVHGVWGVSPFEAVSASSSPGWILIVSLLFKVLGINSGIPLALNVLAGVGLAYVIDRILRWYVKPLLIRTAILVAVLFAVPTSYFISLGMEHTLQILLIAIYFSFATKIAAPQYRFSNRDRWLLLALCALMVSIRVEDAVLIPVPFVYALIKKDGWTAASLAVGPLLAFGVFALIAHSQGFGIEPTSMMVKRVHLSIPPNGFVFMGHKIPVEHMTTLEWFLLRFWENVVLYREVSLFILAMVLVLVALSLRPSGRGSSILLVATAVSGFAFHAANGQFGWYSRYEGYLVVFSVLTLVQVCAESVKLLKAPTASYESGRIRMAEPDLRWLKAYVPFAITALAVGCLTVRSSYALATDGEMMRDVGWQQVQFGNFLNRYYPGGNVLLNDIGAASYYSDFHLLDVFGLGTPEIAKAKVEGTYDAPYLANMILQRQIDVAMIYIATLPKSNQLSYPLIPVATWDLPKGSIFGDQVMILAGNPEKAALLSSQLKQFQSSLPPGVTVKYFQQQ